MSVSRSPSVIQLKKPSYGNNRSLSPRNSSQENSLIVEGKRRWKPSYKVQLKLRELNVFGAGTNRFPSKRTHVSSSDSTKSIHSASDKELYSGSTDSSDCARLGAPSHNEMKSEGSSQWTGPKLTSGKVILRKARLKLNTQSSPGADGPFSVNLNSGNPSLPGTVVCGVCGAVRFYRFVKQARKFGIFSCESCRKFVSKMMKRQACSKGGNLPVLECHKGAGTCSVPPIVRSQQWKPGRGTQFRCSYKARCPACWLKMCLRSFNMPDALRDSMSLMLPPEMRKGLDKLPKNHLLMHFENNSSFVQSKPVEVERLPLISVMDTLGSKSNLKTNKTEGRGLGKNVFDTSAQAEQKAVVGSLKELSKRDKQKNSGKGNHDKSKREKHLHPNRILKKATKKLVKCKDNPESSIERLKKKKNSGVKFRKKNGQKCDSRIPGSDVTRRQRLDLKGPRVKHVCRSASIVLGQPQATFPLDKRAEKIQVKPVQEFSKAPPRSSCCLDCMGPSSSTVKIHDVEKNSQSQSVGDVGRSMKVSASVNAESFENSERMKLISSTDTASNSQDEELSVSSTYRRSSKPTLSSTTVPQQSPSVSVLPISPMVRTLPVLGKRAVPDVQNLVSIDFWESYDPEEVCNTGFGLIGSDPFHVRAMCFLCGSAGHEKLIHCASCCEPYHKFCLEDGLRDASFLSDGNNANSNEKWQYNWVCQRCTVCHSCGRGLGQQLSCQRCHRTYHTECLGADRLSSRLHSPDRPWVCSSCLRCKSCGVADVTHFVGNLPLCKICFKLRQKGNYCPLCQRCYEDDDYDTKMMECGQCKCWVHAKCEGLSDEKYQVLSYLPESVEFICRMCCAIPPAPWWLAVEEELKAGYLGVLKSLSKNRKACAMLKWSPKKQCLCRPTLVAKRLEFQEISDRDTETDEQSDSAREDKNISIIPRKEDLQSSQGEIISASKITHPLEKKSDETQRNQHKVETDHTLLNSVSQPQLPITDSLTSITVPGIEEKCTLNVEVSLPDSSSSKDSSVNQTDMRNFAEKSQVTNISITNTLRQLREKYNIRDCSVRIENCVPKSSSKQPLTVKIEDNDTGFSPDSTFSECSSKSPAKVQVVSLATPASDSGIGSTDDELKPNYIEEEQEYAKDECSEAAEFSPSVQSSQLLEFAYRNNNSSDVEKCSEMNCDTSENVTSECIKECYCLDQHTLTKPSPTLLSIKKKVNANEYSSLLQFHQEMEQLIARAQCPELLETYHHTLKEVFPWFDPKYARVSINWKEGRPGHEESLPCIPVHVEQDHSVNEELVTEQIHVTRNIGGTEGSNHMASKCMVGKSDEYYYSGFTVQDLRTCTLCKGVGDGLPVEEGRLLYCGQNEWVHANCALWSAEVFEEIDGSLQNVHSAVSRGRMIRCRACGKKGASVGCCARNCAETFHFPCARRIGCSFMDDKTVFCSAHLMEAAGKPLHLDIEFDIRRPIYVELDRKKKKFVEPCQVKFMIGSLLIENLGEFVSASDHSDIIVPADFQCTRLYWSSVEPWRIVRYYVRTMVHRAEPQLILDLGKNLTVDHTQEQKLVKQKLEEVSRWHQQLISHQKSTGKKITGNLETFKTKINHLPSETHTVTQSLKKQPKKTAEEKVVQQVMDQLLDAVCNKDVEDSCLSDPQNTADLLPPELKDAIFEDIPHDLLDGISMQDIFPKLMSCEDLAAVDLKSDICFGSEVPKEEKEELSEDGILDTEVEQVSSCELVKGRKHEQSISEFGTQTDLWFHQYSDPREQVQELVEDFCQNVYMKGSMQMNSSRELKRSKSEVIPQPVSKKIGSSGRSHQRSCSLTWSCKLDGTLTSSAKRRKGTRTMPRSGGEGASSLVMVVDSERAHMLQELRLPDGVLVALARSGTPGMASSVADSVRELKYRLEEETASSEVTTSVGRWRSTHQKEEGKENKCFLWHGRSQPRILQLDGAVDSNSSSSSGSEGGSPTRQVDVDDLNLFPPTGPCKNLHNAIAERIACEEEPVKCDRCHRTYRTRTSFERHLPTCSSDFILSTSESDSENTRSSEEEGSKKQKFPPVNCQNDSSPAVQLDNLSEKQVKEEITENIKSKSQFASAILSHSPSAQSKPKATQPSHRIHAVNGRPRGRPSSRTYTPRFVRKENPHPVINMPPHSQQSVPCQTHLSQQPATPTVIMQQVPSTNMVPAFVEAFQQQTGQSLQYIATIDAHNNGYNKTPYLTAAPNSLVPGTFQLQASPENYVGLQNGGISVLPSVQLAPPQPTVIGTLIHQTPPATIQCVAAEQVVLGSAPAIEMYTDQTGGMYLTSQPMYYGLETIVSNTVMSSSQFVSAAVPGMMAASSSFSATTTQVFQASKLVEPIVDVPSSFVIMNPHTAQLNPESGMGRPDMLGCTSSSLPMNLPSPAAPQPSPRVIPQTQAPAVHNIPWSYQEYSSSESYMPPNGDFKHFTPHTSQNVRINVSNVCRNAPCTPPTPPAPPPSTHVQLAPQPPPTPPPPLLPRSQPLTQPLLQHKTTEFIKIHVPFSTNANSTMRNQTLDSTKTFKTNNRVEVPIRTINRVFPLKVNPSLGIPQPVPKINKEPGSDEGTHNKPIQGTDGRVTIIPIPQNKTGNSNSNKQPNSLKLVFQKQAQDGYYKISNQNHQSKLIDTPKSGTVSNQPLSVRAVKIKPRVVAVSEKQKEAQLIGTPVLQTESKMNIQNGTTNTSHLQNGKVPPFQAKHLLGSNASPTITYEVHSQDGFSCTSSSITEVWQKVFEAVQEARVLHKMPRLPENPFSATSAGLQMLGFRHNALRYLVEQLPGVGRCIKYKPRYHKLRPPGPDEDVDALPRENPSGCARCEPFKVRSPYDMFSWLASRHRQPPKFVISTDGESAVSNRRATSSNLPMAMRFRHLKETSKEAVGVYRSNIHGRGLFCLRDIEAGEMVIEYAGEVIRSMLTDKREKYYESKDIGCYMFRIDDQLVVDATMRGNAARFINHSCEPNCYSRVVDILGKKHILIFALRRIPQGEELTYDYKFPFEDVKIPCTCGSRKCRKYLN
ncbi:histone-lysine N-methyltransferase trithorax isoform X1 [Zootermopsis nevadensis]|uniref:histone-lysine N-methyltransferase trithorax isoform X1 n=1 Tax=Zootermopsis nevadensis TaxID=136037 RepID=UPI000B8ECB27|nr:histone-lysine N-methyltransferase trithorax isoform X1 [Zootermopsis nevadensis]